jgi:lysozyme
MEDIMADAAIPTAPGLPVVIDISRFQGAIDFAKVKAAGIQGVIAKATQGTAYVDPLFAQYAAGAKAAGLLFGAYHFGTGSTGSSQAAHFVDTVTRVVGTTDGVLLALDFEDNSHGSAITLDEAEDFIHEVEARTGKFPGIYGGSYLKEAISKTSSPPDVLKNCGLWIAQYGPRPVFPTNIWPKYTLWQFTDGDIGKFGPRHTNGIHAASDHDTFNGAQGDLTAFWQ